MQKSVDASAIVFHIVVLFQRNLCDVIYNVFCFNKIVKALLVFIQKEFTL